MDDILKDERFKHIASDPKFRRMPKHERKVKIDKRFQGMFKDKRFQVTYTIDKRGRPINQTSTQNLRKYYDLPSDEEGPESETDNEESVKSENSKKSKQKDKSKRKESQGETKSGKNEEEENSDFKGSEEEDKNENEDSSEDNCFSSNGALLRIKPPVEDDAVDTEGHSSENENIEEDSAEALDENEKQLLIRSKHDSKITEQVKIKLQDMSVNYARGEGVLMTDSSSDDESSEEEEDEIEHNWGELDKEADTTDEISRRLAVCNMDWDRIRAVDLMVLFNSFLPSGGLVKSVTIYPSEFGLKRMKEEEISGPQELTQDIKERSIQEGDENEEGSEYQMEKLRQYQLNRLKYYYAVVEFDSAETANKVYTECDGIEYESTATKLDLRFVPDEMEFDQEPKEVCREIPELSKYQPRQFTTTALQQVKVELTWDETNPERQEFTQKVNSGKLDEINDNDLHAYLANETSESEEDVEKNEKPEKGDSTSEGDHDPIEKYKSLLKEIEEQEEAKQKKDVELEFTWGLGTEEKAEKLVKERQQKEENLTPFEQYLEKRKAKRKAKRDERKKTRDTDKNGNLDSECSEISDSDAGITSNGKTKSGRKKKSDQNSEHNSDENNEERRKAELELLLMDENDANNKQHFNMKKIEETAVMSKSKKKRLNKKKGEEQQEDNFEVNVKDPRFNALFTSHHYNIDPADPHYRKTKGTEALVTEKLKRRAIDDRTEVVEAKQPKKDKKMNVELQALVKSVKRNTQNIARPIKRS